MNEEVRVQVVKYPDRECLVLRWKDPLTGKVKTKSAGTSSRKDAERKAGALEKEISAGTYATRKLSWDQFRERLRIEMLIGKSNNTVTQYEGVLDRVEQVLKLSTPRDLTPERIAHYAAKLRADKLREATVGKHLRHLRSVLRWAEEVGIIDRAPKSRIKATTTAKGRPLTTEEVERALLVVPKVVGDTLAGSWHFYIDGLYRTGLRLAESLLLSWDGDGIRIIDIDGDTPAVLFPAALQKNRKTQVVPLMPDAVELMRTIPAAERHGYVFKPVTRTGRASCDKASRLVKAVFEKAGITTKRETASDGSEVKQFASCHDLRRSFATRWARVLMPFELARVMRHSSMQTTSDFYVSTDSADISRKAANAWRNSGSKGNKSGNTEGECVTGAKIVNPVSAHNQSG
jgi:integrase